MPVGATVNIGDPAQELDQVHPRLHPITPPASGRVGLHQDRYTPLVVAGRTWRDADYRLDDVEYEKGPSSQCATEAMLRGDMEAARWFAVDYALWRDGSPTLNEGGIHWVLERSPLANHVSPAAREAGEWMIAKAGA